MDYLTVIFTDFLKLAPFKNLVIKILKLRTVGRCILYNELVFFFTKVTVKDITLLYYFYYKQGK